MRKIKCSIEIKSSRKKVWKTLWSNITFPNWANIIDGGMYMKGSLIEGEEVEFISSVNGYGVISLVEKLIPNEYVLFKHKEDTEDSGLHKRKDEWAGGRESYYLKEKDEVTELIVKMDVPAKLEELFNERLANALKRIKTLSE